MLIVKFAALCSIKEIFHTITSAHNKHGIARSTIQHWIKAGRIRKRAGGLVSELDLLRCRHEQRTGRGCGFWKDIPLSFNDQIVRHFLRSHGERSLRIVLFGCVNKIYKGRDETVFARKSKPFKKVLLDALSSFGEKLLDRQTEEAERAAEHVPDQAEWDAEFRLSPEQQAQSDALAKRMNKNFKSFEELKCEGAFPSRRRAKKNNKTHMTSKEQNEEVEWIFELEDWWTVAALRHVDKALCSAVNISITGHGDFLMTWEEKHPELGSRKDLLGPEQDQEIRNAGKTSPEWNDMLKRLPSSEHEAVLTRSEAYELFATALLPIEFHPDAGLRGEEE